MQVYVRPKKKLLGSSLAFNLKEGPLRCAKVFDKSWVILKYSCSIMQWCWNARNFGGALYKRIAFKWFFPLFLISVNLGGLIGPWGSDTPVCHCASMKVQACKSTVYIRVVVKFQVNLLTLRHIVQPNLFQLQSYL